MAKTINQTTNIAVMQTDIGYIKKSLENIDSQLKTMDTSFVKKDDIKDMVTELSDHETRIRAAESSITKILTYGSASLIGLAILEFLISKYL